MADLKISELAALAGADLVAADLLAVADISASETKKITVTDFFGNASTLIADATIPSAKILFGSGTIAGSALVAGGVGTTQLASSAVTAAKLAANSTVNVASALPVSGSYTGQIALETTLNKGYIWNGSQWVAFKAAGSVNSIVSTNVGPINISVSTVGDAVTISAALANSTAAGQFIAGPTNSAGAVSLRPIVGNDMPTATASTKGAVIVNGNGLRMSDDTIEIDNVVAPENQDYHLVQYGANGLITGGRTVTSNDLPLATASTVGVVSPGTGVAVSPSGALNHSNVVVAGSAAKVSFDSQGHITAGLNLLSTDIPEISATKITSDTLSTSVIGNQSITGQKLANFSVTRFGGAGSTEGIVSFPAAEFTGQYFFDSSQGDLYLWDGNAWQPITITAGEIVFGGTYNANTNKVVSTTAAGAAAGLVAGSALPAAAASNNRYYVVVAVSGTGSTPAPAVSLAPPDMLLSNGSAWEEIDVSGTVAAQIATNISFTPAGNISASNVQAAIQELDTEKVSTAGGTISGELLIGAAGSLVFEGSTANDFETTLAVVDPTADRTITFPNISGTVVTSGDTGTITDAMLAGSIAYNKLSLTGAIVNSDIATAAAVAYSKLSLTGSVVNADIASSAAIAYSKLSLFNSIVNTDIASAAAIADSKLATISTAGKVSNSATTATNANTASAIVARDAFGNFSAGTITANLTGTASNVTTNANLTGHITSVGNAAVLGSFTSAELRTALTDETGSGAAVFATSPTLVTPALGTPSSGNLVNCTFPILNQNTTGNAATVTTNANLTGDVTSVGNATSIATGVIVDADINASAAIADTKLATISTAGKVSGSAITSGTIGGSTAITTTGDVTLNNQADLRFGDSDGSNYIALQAPATVASNVTLTLPAADGTSGQFLSTNGSGTLSWSTGAGYTITTTATSKTLADRERCTVTAATQTITLPASPAAGAEVTITIAGTFTDTIIARNGSNLMSLAENLTIDKPDVTVTLYYVDATRGWRIL